MKKEKLTTKISGVGVLYIFVSLAAAFFFCWQIYGNLTEIDSKATSESMENATKSMQRLKSYSGSSVAEAYYNDHGEYLEGETKIQNAQMEFQKRTSIATDVIGLLLCLALFTYGTSRSVTVKMSDLHKTKTSSHKTEESYEDDEL